MRTWVGPRVQRGLRIGIPGACAVLVAGCLTIRGVSPDPVAPGQMLQVDVSNAIGPWAIEPGPILQLDGLPMVLNISTSSELGFQVPPGTPAGTHEIEILDPPGLLEAVTIVLLLRNRIDSREIRVQ